MWKKRSPWGLWRAGKTNEVSGGTGGCGDGTPGVIIITHRKLHLNIITTITHGHDREGNLTVQAFPIFNIMIWLCSEQKSRGKTKNRKDSRNLNQIEHWTLNRSPILIPEGESCSRKDIIYILSFSPTFHFSNQIKQIVQIDCQNASL